MQTTLRVLASNVSYYVATIKQKFFSITQDTENNSDNAQISRKVL